jgi:hypothetical protein
VVPAVTVAARWALTAGPLWTVATRESPARPARRPPAASPVWISAGTVRAAHRPATRRPTPDAGMTAPSAPVALGERGTCRAPARRDPPCHDPNATTSGGGAGGGAGGSSFAASGVTSPVLITGVNAGAINNGNGEITITWTPRHAPDHGAHPRADSRSRTDPDQNQEALTKERTAGMRKQNVARAVVVGAALALAVPGYTAVASSWCRQRNPTVRARFAVGVAIHQVAVCGAGLGQHAAVGHRDHAVIARPGVVGLAGQPDGEAVVCCATDSGDGLRRTWAGVGRRVLRGSRSPQR